MSAAYPMAMALAPAIDCRRCPRLAGLRDALRAEQPDWWNAPVPAFGDERAWLAIVGLAPGKLGANRTGRAFTGDGAGPLLFDTLARHGLASGTYDADADDDLRLDGAIILNAVKCLPPENKPTPAEIHACRDHLETEIAGLPNAHFFVALGRIAHQSLVKALGGRLPEAPFAHLAEHRMPGGQVVLDSYHCSRYNQNTRRLTPAMFDAVFGRALELRKAVQCSSC